jgi:hypothetical protein
LRYSSQLKEINKSFPEEKVSMEIFKSEETL